MLYTCVCVAESSTEHQQPRVVEVTRWRVQPHDAVLVKGAPAQLSCAAAPLEHDTWSYTWFKDGQQLTEGAGIRLLGNGSLNIARVRQGDSRNDSGVYVCMANCSLGQMRSRPAMVRIACKLSFRDFHFGFQWYFSSQLWRFSTKAG